MSLDISWRYTLWSPDVLRRITPDRVAEYFRRQGWIEHPFGDGLLRRFEHPTRRWADGTPRHYVFPAVDDDEDYSRQVADFLVNLSKLRDISPDDLLRELTAADAPPKPKRRRKPA